MISTGRGNPGWDWRGSGKSAHQISTRWISGAALTTCPSAETSSVRGQGRGEFRRGCRNKARSIFQSCVQNGCAPETLRWPSHIVDFGKSGVSWRRPRPCETDRPAEKRQFSYLQYNKSYTTLGRRRSLGSTAQTTHIVVQQLSDSIQTYIRRRICGQGLLIVRIMPLTHK